MTRPATHMRAMQPLRDYLLFASEAELVGLAGLAMIGVALFALAAEKRRNAKARFDALGWMPWTPIFMGSAMIAAALLMLAIKGVMTGE